MSNAQGVTGVSDRMQLAYAVIWGQRFFRRRFDEITLTPNHGFIEMPFETSSSTMSIPAMLPSEMLVEERSSAELAIRHERILWHGADTLPSGALIQPLGIAAGNCIEHEYGLAFLARRFVHGRH